MALSFEESLRRAREAIAKKTAALETEPVSPVSADYGIAVMDMAATTDVLAPEDTIAAYSGDDWTLDNNYLYYTEYHDDKISVVDENKKITVHKGQINLTQEINSQFVPFEMPRFYDGFDLKTATVLIYFVNAAGAGDYANPINMYYSQDKLKFGWLIDDRATVVSGKLHFEIHAVGVNSKGNEYIWKTMPSDDLEVMKSLSGEGVIEPDTTWISSFMTQVMEQVALAQGYANTAAGSVAAVEGYASDAAASVDEASEIVEAGKADMQAMVDSAAADLGASVEDAVNTKVEEALLGYYSAEQVDELIAGVDVSDQLNALKEELQGEIDSIDGLAAFHVTYDGTTMKFFNGETVMNEIQINSDPSAEWVSAYTESVREIAAAGDTAVLQELVAYKETTDTDLAGIHETVDALPETLQNDYYNKEAADGKFADKVVVSDAVTKLANVEAAAKTAKEGLDTANEKLAELDEEVAGIDKSPRLTYGIDYNNVEDPEVGENQLAFFEYENEGQENEVRTLKKRVPIVGGGGGTGTSSVLKIEYVTKTPYVVTVNDKAEITFLFSGEDSSGVEILEGTYTLKVANVTVASGVVTAGENTIDITDYLRLGTQKVLLSITDDNNSLATRSWTVQKIDVKIESSFNDTLTYPIGPVSFSYTPYGAISKEIHFKLDGEELEPTITSVSGIQMGYVIPVQEHGAHLFEIWATAEVEKNTIESNHIVKDILFWDSESTVPVIGCAMQDFVVRQYDIVNIPYVVHDPGTETPKVTLAVDGKTVSELTLDSASQLWAFKSADVGEHVLTITCGTVVKTLRVVVEKLDIEIEPVTANLAFDFNPVGYSNNDIGSRLWTYGDVSMSVSDNFDWVNGGYQIDDNGDSYFCIKAGTSAEIDYKLFADDAKKNGKEFKLVFKSVNVADPDAVFLHCLDNTLADNHIGIKMAVHETVIYGMTKRLELPYSEGDIIEFEFNISKNSEKVPMVMGYEDGVSTRPLVYDDTVDFTQVTPKVISLGSPDCDLHIYRFKVYAESLTDAGILNNFIADARNATEMVNRYTRNQIYDENQMLDPDVFAKKNPHLRVYKLSAPYFTNKKSDKVPDTTIQQIYGSGDSVLDQWTAYESQHSGQGTSSDNYGQAGRNIDFIMNKDGSYFILGDGSRVDKITQTRTSVPVNYLNFKANIASSNNMTNAMLANRYNEFCPYKRPFIRSEEEDISFIKDTMEFHNAVVFIRETDTQQDENGNYINHREFNDTDWHFYALGNIGDSKKTDDTRLTDPDDRYECCIEIMDIQRPLSDFPVDTMRNAMIYEEEDDGTRIYFWATDDNLANLYELIDGEYVLTQDTTVDLSKTYYIDALVHDDFSENFTYGWRYLWEDGTDEENAEVFDYCKQKWIEAYRFITTSSDEEFRAHFGDYFVVDSALFNYLFTLRYCMVDNRAKNMFLHYGKTGDVDSEGNPIRKWDLNWDYDNDTACGLNNYGKQVYRYGLEDTDTDANGVEVFREMDSVLFNRIRVLFKDELKAMYNELESENAWDAASFLNQADAWQSEFPEELWRLDIQRKYIRTYTESHINGKGNPDFLTDMANGKMKYHRRQWERNQEKYMQSKFQTARAAEDTLFMRCIVPEGELAVSPNYNLKLVPYNYMYLNVQYGGGTPVSRRAEPGNVYEIPYSGDQVDIINVYNASIIQDFGDLSACYVATANISKLEKARRFILGSSAEGYNNPSFTQLTPGENPLMEEINIENLTGLTQSLDLRGLFSLKRLFAGGSNISGVVFARGGLIEYADLPAIGALRMGDLAYLETLDIASLEKLTGVVVENCPAVDMVSLLTGAANLNRIRVTGIDWVLPDTSLLARLYGMRGYDKNWDNADRSVLTGAIHVPVLYQQELNDYNEAWPELHLTCDTLVEQFVVSFVNHDGTLIEKQYIIKGEKAVDPVTREDNPVIPQREFTISHSFAFDRWLPDGATTVTDQIFRNVTFTASYTSALREYTVKHVSMGKVLQEKNGLYGTNILYEGKTPTYTDQEESAYAFYLFNRWDKSGVVDGDKVVNAVYDKYVYDGNLSQIDFSDMTPVQIYALTKLYKAGVISLPSEGYIEAGSTMRFTLGNDINYDGIEKYLVVDAPMVFDGTNHIDTGVSPFDMDRDFVFAVDYEFAADCPAGGVLMQCLQPITLQGVKLSYATKPRIAWNQTSSEALSPAEKREILVLRHKAGENRLTVYNSNIRGEIAVFDMDGTVASGTFGNPLVFGAAKASDGVFENHAKGTVYWAKVWYTDLGEDACMSLAAWVHEDMEMEICSFRSYTLADDQTQRCSFTLLAKNLLCTDSVWNTGNHSVGGYGSSAIRSLLNERVYKAIPEQIRQMVKNVLVYSGDGKTAEVISSPCFVYLPAFAELFSGQSGGGGHTDAANEPYISEGSLISYMTSSAVRKRADNTGEYHVYWTRSPKVGTSSNQYIWTVSATGTANSYEYANKSNYVLIQFSL